MWKAMDNPKTTLRNFEEKAIFPLDLQSLNLLLLDIDQNNTLI